jgi:SpoVK/Ycf46/Vps4 family AAA+-type ATPase
MQEREGAVFVAATANDLTSIPPELLRKGRFDEVFFIDLPDEAARREIFAIHLRLRRQKPESFDLDALARDTGGFSGAEIEQAVVSALYGLVAEGGSALTDARLRAELQRTVPLVLSCREEIDALRRTARERFVPAD